MFARDNEAVWPAQIVLTALGLVVAGAVTALLTLRGRRISARVGRRNELLPS